jgi:hypothetical protein
MQRHKEFVGEIQSVKYASLSNIALNKCKTRKITESTRAIVTHWKVVAH